jgi:hypothetical protein
MEMLRKLIIVVVGAAYVAGQCAALPHTHANEAPGHSARPHVHANWYLAALGIQPPGHTHSHGHSHAQPPNKERPPEPFSAPDEQGHDQTCVYLSGPGMQPAPVKIQRSSPISYAFGFEVCSSPASREEYAIAWCIPPPAAGSSLPLYLILRTLRI